MDHYQPLRTLNPEEHHQHTVYLAHYHIREDLQVLEDHPLIFHGKCQSPVLALICLIQEGRLLHTVLLHPEPAQNSEGVLQQIHGVAAVAV